MTERSTHEKRFPLRFRAIGFDLDGTLLDTAPDIAAALNHALQVGGKPPLPYGDVRGLIGGGAKRLLARALTSREGERIDPDVLDPLYAELLAHYRANISVNTCAFEGMERALDRLAAEGIALGVATNKLESLARQLLEEMGLADRFAVIVGGDTLGTENSKPKPDMLHHLVEKCGGGPAAFVGDSVFDVRAAKAAGMPSIAVSFGYPGMAVEDLGADRLIDHYDALIPALAEL